MALIRTHGFIDVHAHLREPGATYKEDFFSGSRAAVKGGFTFVCDMPNNQLPTISIDRLKEKVRLTSEHSIADIGFHYGTDGENIDSFKKAWNDPRVVGLKVYCDHTTGSLCIDDERTRERVITAWRSKKPILVHAEGENLERMISLCDRYGRRMHACHLSQADEVQMVRIAKKKKMSVSAGTCPHYLFMTTTDRERLKGYATMRPPLGTEADKRALWEGVSDGTIDLIETDHAPHTKEEKERDIPAYGVPGLETASGLLYRAAMDGLIEHAHILRLLHDNPKRIFDIPDQANTYIEYDPDRPYTCGEDGYATKCGWSPFNGWKLFGKMETVVCKGKTLLAHGKLMR